MNDTYQHTYHLTAGECDATGSLPLPLLAERLIEAASEHANILGIGYSRLVELGIGWVLSRMSIEMTEYPGINDTYTITTWIETINSRFSERNMMITNSEGKPIGYARTVWAAINFKTRTLGDLSALTSGPLPTAGIPCPINKMPRLTPPEEGCAEFDYTFRYCDLDFNRHVNTVRYIELILNRWPLSTYDDCLINRFDITFSRECYFGQTVKVRTEQERLTSNCELLRDGTKVVSARIVRTPRKEISSHLQAQ